MLQLASETLRDPPDVAWWKTFITHPQDFPPQPFVRNRLSADQSDVVHQLLAPAVLAGCTLVRRGPPYDGGYALCLELLSSSTSAVYNFGIAGNDANGCELARTVRVPVNQFDCFNTDVPACNAGTGGLARFAPTCVGPESALRVSADGRQRLEYDTMENMIQRNGDTGRQLLVLMDVEGAEYSVLTTCEDAVLSQISQLSLELHGIDGNASRTIALLRRLAHFFHVAHVHCNNCCCTEGWEGLACSHVEALFVNKRLVSTDGHKPLALPVPFIDFPGIPFYRDCPWRGGSL